MRGSNLSLPFSSSCSYLNYALFSKQGRPLFIQKPKDLLVLTDLLYPVTQLFLTLSAQRRVSFIGPPLLPGSVSVCSTELLALCGCVHFVWRVDSGLSVVALSDRMGTVLSKFDQREVDGYGGRWRIPFGASALKAVDT